MQRSRFQVRLIRPLHHHLFQPSSQQHASPGNYSNSGVSISVQDHGRLGSRYYSTLGLSDSKDENMLERSETRQTIVERIPDTARNHFVAMAGEFVGTLLFLFFALSGTQTANSINTSSGLTLAEAGSNPQQLLYISLCFGFSLAVNAWTFFRISGGLFNPAVTLGLCLIGAVGWVRGALLFITQIVAGIAAAALVSCMFPGPLNVGTTLNDETSTAQGLFIEMFLTAQLVFTIFMLAAEKHRGTFMAPVGIGLSLFIAELTGVHYTGGSLNPARSFGPCVANRSFPQIHWIYWLGPLLGAVVAAGLYHLFTFLDYETANPGQDDKTRAEAEANERRSKRKDSGLSPAITSEYSWNGGTAEADVFTTGGCENCRSKERRGTFESTSPTLMETTTLGSHKDVITTDHAHQPRERYMEYMERPHIVVTNPTPPVTRTSSGSMGFEQSDPRGQSGLTERQSVGGRFSRTVSSGV